MTDVGVTCQFCGLGFNTPAFNVNLYTWDRYPDLNNYTFTCPDCGQQSKRPASAGVLKSLAFAPVNRVHIVVPAEADDPTRYGGCRDDLLDALNELHGGDITCPTN